MGWISLLAASCFLALVAGEAVEPVTLTRCCPPGKILKITRNDPRHDIFGRYSETYDVKCVRSRRAGSDSLYDGRYIEVSDGAGAELEMEVKADANPVLPTCGMGQRIVKISLVNSTVSSANASDSRVPPPPPRRVTLGDYSCSGGNCRKGNVYVDGRAVCDDDWDDTDAEVVCRELGFTSGGYATKESYFGRVDLETVSGWDQVRCRGHESSLTECRHDTYDDCGNSEGAGVVCYGGDDDEDGYRESMRYSDYSDYSSSSGRRGEIVGKLKSNGDLSLEMGSTEENIYKSGEYCITSNVQSSDYNLGENDAVAYMCEPCSSEFVCTGLKTLFDSFHGPTANEITPDSRYPDPMRNAIIKVMDKDGSGSVNFDEFKESVNTYIKKVFDILDTDKDGFLAEDVSIKKFPAKLFREALNAGYTYFDTNEDDTIAVEDVPADTFRDRDDDGKVSLREIFGVSLINLPAPLYKLYVTLDKDKNEKLSFDEASSFLKGALSILDHGDDCSVDINDVIAFLKDHKLPSEYRLAIKLMGDYYGTLGDYIVRFFVQSADANGDELTSLAEIEAINNLDFMSTIEKIVVNLISAGSRPFSFLERGDRYGSSYHDGNSRMNEIWLNILYDFASNRKFDSVPENYCGLE